MSDALFCLDDTVASRLASAHGTPLFAYSGSAARKNYERLRNTLPPRVRIAYAVKANPFPPLLQLFAELGTDFDCASAGELSRVADLQLKSNRILFAGPGKRRTEIEYALKLGARLNAESMEDLFAVNDLSPHPVKVNLRIHPRFGSESGGRIIGGSGPSAFGIDQDQVPDVLKSIRHAKNVSVGGIHVFVASNQRSAENLLSIYRQVFALAKSLQSELDSEIDQIDLGGGLGVPYAKTEDPLNIDALARGISELLAEHTWFHGELIIEPGRYLAASAGVYVATVVSTKQSRGETFAILDGGINHLIRPCLTGQPFPVRAIGRTGELTDITLAGPLCTSLDRLGTAQLPPLKTGDLLLFGMVGAYGFTEGMTNFLSHPVPPEIWLP